MLHGGVSYFAFVCVCLSVRLQQNLKITEPINFIFGEGLLSDQGRKPFDFENKRPRGLDALLGHLLVKRIQVMFRLSSTKIPEYLSQK